MFNKILVPLDPGQHAESVLPFVEVLAKQLDDEVLLLSVLPGADDLVAHTDQVQSALERFELTRRQAATMYLDRVRERLLRAEIPADTEICAGDVAATIVETARREGAGLIAMSTHGRSGSERWLLGSVADRVVRSATLPVLLVRPNEAAACWTVGPTDIIVPLDGSPAAECAIPIARDLATSFGATIRLLRTVPAGMWMSDGSMYVGATDLISAVEDEATQYLEQIAAKTRGGGATVTTRFALLRDPDGEIEDLVAECERPLIAMTSHGRSGIGRVVFGSIADRVARGSSAPVVIVRGETAG